MALELNISSVLIISSFISYLLFNTLFLIAEQWWAFAMLVTSISYIPFLYSDSKKNRKNLAAWLMIHFICLIVQIGWTIFFFVEIFANNSMVVQKWLKTYLKNSVNKADVARYASIAMCVDGIVTSIIMIFCAVVVSCKLMVSDEESEVSSLPSRSETLAVRLDHDLLKIDSGLPRLRATADGSVSAVPTSGGVHSVWGRPSMFQSERI